MDVPVNYKSYKEVIIAAKIKSSNYENQCQHFFWSLTDGWAGNRAGWFTSRSSLSAKTGIAPCRLTTERKQPIGGEA